MAETFLFVQEPMTGFTLDTTYGYLATLANPSFSLVSGKTYLVIWDDLEKPYTVTAYDATIPGIGSFVAIGNGTALGYQGNNEPFVIAANSAMAYFLAFADSASSHVVAIAQADGIILLDYKDEPTAYYGREVLEVPSTVEGESVNYVREDLVPEQVEKTLDLDFSGGPMTVTPEAGQAFSKVNIPVPEGLAPENIPEGMTIAGIIGTLVASGGTKIALGTFTGNEGTVTITHGLGVSPDIIVVMSEGTLSANLINWAWGISGKLKDSAAFYNAQGCSYRVSGYSAVSYTYPVEHATYGVLWGANTQTFQFGNGTYKSEKSRAYTWFAIGGLT